jgi:hypothetical protein
MTGMELATGILHGFTSEAAGALGAAAGAGVVWVMHKIQSKIKDKQKKAHSVAAVNGLDIEVYKHLADLLARTNADRASVIQFHNGTFFVNSVSQMKMSCTHEVTKPGVSREILNFKDILISAFPYTIQQIVNQQSVVLIADEIKEEPLRHRMNQSGTKIAVVGVMRNNDVIEGEIIIDYIDENSLDKLDEPLMRELVEQNADTIGYLLRSSK